MNCHALCMAPCAKRPIVGLGPLIDVTTIAALFFDCISEFLSQNVVLLAIAREDEIALSDERSEIKRTEQTYASTDFRRIHFGTPLGSRRQ